MQDPTPLYHRIYLVLREQIREGRFQSGVPMPSELELAHTFSVSRVTLRKTLERLEREGLIRRERGRGTFALTPTDSRPMRADVTGLVENLLAMGLRTEVRVEAFSYEPMPPDVAAEMEAAPGSLAQRAVRVRSLEGLPFSYAVTYVREDVGRTYDARDLETTPLLRLIERSGVGIGGAHQRMSASAADSRVAGFLDVEVGAPLLSITRIVRDAEGRGVERIRALYRPDRYEFELELTPDSGPGGTMWQPRPGTP